MKVSLVLFVVMPRDVRIILVTVDISMVYCPRLKCKAQYATEKDGSTCIIHIVDKIRRQKRNFQLHDRQTTQHATI